MNDLITMLNHLVAGWAASREGTRESGGAFALEEIHLEADGFYIRGRVDTAVARGEFALRGRIEASGHARHKIHLRIERCPEKFDALLEPLREVLESARFDAVFDFDAATQEV